MKSNRDALKLPSHPATPRLRIGHSVDNLCSGDHQGEGGYVHRTLQLRRRSSIDGVSKGAQTKTYPEFHQATPWLALCLVSR